MSLRVDIDALKRVLKAFPSALNQEMRKAFTDHGNVFIDTMITKRFRGYSGPKNTGTILQNRTGSLRRSFGKSVLGGTAGKPLTLLVYSQGVKYARLQEYGGTIRPKRAKNLTIPLDDALTGSGAPRYTSARDLLSRYPEDVFFFTSKKGNTFLASYGKPGGKRRKEEDVQLLYILKKQVEVPARLGFRDTWTSPALVQDRRARFTAAGEAASRRVGGGG